MHQRPVSPKTGSPNGDRGHEKGCGPSFGAFVRGSRWLVGSADCLVRLGSVDFQRETCSRRFRGRERECSSNMLGKRMRDIEAETEAGPVLFRAMTSSACLEEAWNEVRRYAPPCVFDRELDATAVTAQREDDGCFSVAQSVLEQMPADLERLWR